MRQTGAKKRGHGLTLTEVLAAVVLMGVALAPVLEAHVAAQVLGTKVDRATHALALAVKKTEDIRAAARSSFATDFSASSSALSGGYLCTVVDGQEGSDLKSVSVKVGYDVDGDGTLDSEEVDVVLDTQIASLQ